MTIPTGSTGNRTYTATWEANPYTVHFDANAGGDASERHVSGEMADQPFTYDVAQTLTKNAFTVMNGVFTGWNTAADGSGTAYEDQQSVVNLSDEDGATVTLYAQWHFYAPGDADGNDTVDISDATTIMAVIAGTITDEATKARADVNGDTKVDVADVVAILLYLAGK